MLSSTAEYALAAMAQLASEKAGYSTAQQISKKTRIPSAYLAKVFQDLRKAGLVSSRRGRNGGVTLAKPANKISLLEVLDAVDPGRRLGAPRSSSAKSSLKRLELRLAGFMKNLRNELAAMSLADAYVAVPEGRRRAAKTRTASSRI